MTVVLSKNLLDVYGVKSVDELSLVKNVSTGSWGIKKKQLDAISKNLGTKV